MIFPPIIGCPPFEAGSKV